VRWSAVALVAALFLASPASAKKQKKGPDEIGGDNPGRGVNFYSLEKEIALGKQMAQEVEREARIVQDPVVSEYVNRVAQNLVRNSDAVVPFTVKVIDSDEVNAFALPGGFMFVNTGLVLKAGNEAELAGVLAHEIAHVAARHGTKQATRGEIANVASVPVLLMGGWAGYAIQQAAGLAIPMGFLKFSRGMEQQADHLGLEYLYKTGYDPTAFLDFFERIESLEKRKPGAVASVFSTHPVTDDRIRRAQDEIQNEFEPQREYVLDTSEFHDVQNRLNRIENRRSPANHDDNKPTLRRRAAGSDDDERPTLKRRD
jgi:predicted Zn-dependent protease